MEKLCVYGLMKIFEGDKSPQFALRPQIILAPQSRKLKCRGLTVKVT